MAENERPRRRWFRRRQRVPEEEEVQELEEPEIRKPRLWGWVVAALVLLLGSAALSMNLIPGLEGLLGGLGQKTQGVPEAADADDYWQTTTVASSFTGAQPPAGDAGTNNTGVKKQDSIQRVAELYAAMPPNKAASLLETMLSDEAVAVLQAMQPETAAAVLAQMDTTRASELIRMMMSTEKGGGGT